MRNRYSINFFEYYEELLRENPGVSEMGLSWVLFSGKIADEGAEIFGELPGLRDKGPLVMKGLEDSGGDQRVAVRQLGEVVSFLQVNGYGGANSRRVSRLSISGDSLGVYWNLDGDNVLIGASGGGIEFEIDMSFPIEGERLDALRNWSDTIILQEYAASPDWGWKAAVLSFISSATGVILAPSFWDSPDYCFIVAP